jgi:ferredoxin
MYALWILSILRKTGPMTMAARRSDEVQQLYIDPTECIDCGACVPVCPVTAIFALDDLPEKWQAYIETNKNYVDGGRFQPDKYQKASS